MKTLGSEVLWCVFATLVQGWHTCWCHLFRVVQAKFETGMCEMKILGSEVLWCVFVTLVQGWHTCVVSSVKSCSGKVRNRDV